MVNVSFLTLTFMCSENTNNKVWDIDPDKQDGMTQGNPTI